MKQKTNDAMTLSFGFNQILDTDIDIPGAIACDRNSLCERFMRISTGTICPSADAPLYAGNDQALVFTALNVASYNCTTDSIDVNPFPGADADWVSGLLIATALPAALWMQHRFVLHAAAVVPKGSTHAVAIAGASGAGKSFMAKQLLDQGAQLLADDSVALETSGSAIVASGLPGGVHRAISGEKERQFERVSEARSATSAPLGAIIILDGFATEFECSELNKLDAITHIIAHQHRPRIPAALGRIGPVLAQAASVAERVPVNIWRRSKDALRLSSIEQEMLTGLLGT